MSYDKNIRFAFVYGYDENYIISENGQLFDDRHKKCREVFPYKNHKGYLAVSLFDGKKYKSQLLHRLIAQTFLPNPENKKTVNHKNGIKDDNRLENLEWATHSENVLHALNSGLKRRGFFGVRNYDENKKRVLQLNKSNELVSEYSSVRDAERQTGIHNQCIYDVCWGKKKSAGGFRWQYA